MSHWNRPNNTILQSQYWYPHTSGNNILLAGQGGGGVYLGTFSNTSWVQPDIPDLQTNTWNANISGDNIILTGSVFGSETVSSPGVYLGHSKIHLGYNHL